jgi:hypothetical protein
MAQVIIEGNIWVRKNWEGIDSYTFSQTSADSEYYRNDGYVFVRSHTIVTEEMPSEELYMKRYHNLLDTKKSVLAETQIMINEIEEKIQKHLAIGS